MFLKYLILLLFTFQCCPLYGYCQTVIEDAALSRKESIRRTYNMTETAYNALLKKIELSSRVERLKTISESVEQYYSLGKKLENLGKYKQAAECYEKVFKLLSDPLIKRYIKIRNKELKAIAKEEKKRAVQNLESKEDVYSELLSLDNILVELNARIDMVESQKENE